MARMNWGRARWGGSGGYSRDAGWLAPPSAATGTHRTGEKTSWTAPWHHLKPTPPPVFAEVGDRVSVRFPDGNTTTYTLTEDSRSSKDELRVCSPLGWAVWGASAGDTECEAPEGPYRVAIISIDQTPR